MRQCGLAVLTLANSSFPPEMPRRGIREPLHCHFDNGMYEWRKWMIWSPRDTRKPHLGAVSAHGHVAHKHRLLRSEDMLLVRLSMVRIKYGYKMGYVVCPASLSERSYSQPFYILISTRTPSTPACLLSSCRSCSPLPAVIRVG